MNSVYVYIQWVSFFQLKNYFEVYLFLTNVEHIIFFNYIIYYFEIKNEKTTKFGGLFF